MMNIPVASTPASEDRNSTLVSFRFASATFPALRSLLIVISPSSGSSIAQLGQIRHGCCKQALAQACAVCSPNSWSMNKVANLHQQSNSALDAGCTIFKGFAGTQSKRGSQLGPGVHPLVGLRQEGSADVRPFLRPVLQPALWTHPCSITLRRTAMHRDPRRMESQH